MQAGGRPQGGGRTGCIGNSASVPGVRQRMQTGSLRGSVEIESDWANASEQGSHMELCFIQPGRSGRVYRQVERGQWKGGG